MAEGTLRGSARPACSGDTQCDKCQSRATDSAHPESVGCSPTKRWTLILYSLDVGRPATCSDQQNVAEVVSSAFLSQGPQRLCTSCFLWESSLQSWEPELEDTESPR